MPVTRFAPSPTGWLHLGHAYSACFAAAHAGNEIMLLRIEDIDLGRRREEYVAGIEEDLRWLGLAWREPVRRQSDHFAEYAAALARLEALGLLYPCFCTRKSIAIATAGAPHGRTLPYPGTCRRLAPDERTDRMARGDGYALRLDVAKAMGMTGPLAWRDLSLGTIAADPAFQGDVVLARKDFPASYHLAVTWDDAVQDVEIVTRGEDLVESTHIHRLLQALLGLPVPVWHHHKLLADIDGKRLAKRDNAPTLRAMREAGMSADDVRELIVRCEK